MTDAHDPGTYRPLFPVVAEGMAFFAHCATSAPPTPVIEAMSALAGRTSRGRLEPGELERRTAAWRSSAARLIGAGPDEIAFVGNTVQGIQLVACGLDWRAGDNVVGADVEFPANVYPWQNLARLGVTTRQVSTRDGLVATEDVIAALDGRTRLVALSSVQFLTGQRLAIDEIGAACRRRGVLFLVDAVQELGVWPVNVAALPVDFLCAGGHKWLLGPPGTGLFYCRRDRLGDLSVASVGHKSMRPRGDHLPYAFDLKEDASRFEGGALNYIGMAGLAAGLDLLHGAGIARIRDHTLALAMTIDVALRRRGYAVSTPTDPDQRSAIVAFRPPGAAAPEVVERLGRAGIIVTAVSGWVRAAPHLYNDASDVERLLAALP